MATACFPDQSGKAVVRHSFFIIITTGVCHGHTTEIYYEVQPGPNLEIQPVHGVFGGVTPLGEIEMNFFTESEDLPECIERTISEAGTLINEKIVYKDPTTHHLTRIIKNRMVVSYSTAQSIRDWLNDQLDLMDSMNNDPMQSLLSDVTTSKKQ